MSVTVVAVVDVPDDQATTFDPSFERFIADNGWTADVLTAMETRGRSGFGGAVTGGLLRFDDKLVKDEMYCSGPLTLALLEAWKGIGQQETAHRGVLEVIHEFGRESLKIGLEADVLRRIAIDYVASRSLASYRAECHPYLGPDDPERDEIVTKCIDWISKTDHKQYTISRADLEILLRR